MRATALGVVAGAGPGSNLRKGDNVSGTFGMTEYAVMNDKDVEQLMYVCSGLKGDVHWRPSVSLQVVLYWITWTPLDCQVCSANFIYTDY